VERAACDEIGPGPFQGKGRLDDVDDIDSAQELLHEGFGNHRIASGILAQQTEDET